MKEATELKTKNPENPKVLKLAEDVKKEMRKSLNAFETAKLAGPKATLTQEQPPTPKTTEIDMGKEEQEKPRSRLTPPPAIPRNAASYEEISETTTSEKKAESVPFIDDENERLQNSKTEQTKITPRKNGRYVCKTLENLIKSEMPEVQNEILNDLEIVKKFQTNCETIYLP